MKAGDYFLFAVIGLLAAVLVISALPLFGIWSPSGSNDKDKNVMPRMSRMSLTEFDSQLARQFMDKNNDGKCDACGMPVEMCMESGQMQCNMDPSSTIGVLGSAHTHADFKVFIDGKPVDFARQKYYMKSSFIHLDDNQNKEDASGVIHMHATGVPLWVFFKSIGGNLNETCLSLDSGQFCNAKEKKLKFYVNGELRTEFGNYVFSDLDKMLISYGAEAEQEINQQLSAITSFAKEH